MVYVHFGGVCHRAILWPGGLGGGQVQGLARLQRRIGRRGIYDPVAFDSEGNLYGTTWGSGAHGYGTIFKLTPSANGRWAKQVLYNFCALSNCSDGALPLAGVTVEATGNLYGATSTGGSGDVGTIFELTPSSPGPGGWTFSVLFEFGSDVNLILDQSGNLYGPLGPGKYGKGAATELSPGSNGWTETYLYSFCPKLHCLDGDEPTSPLTWDASGNLYGATEGGGKGNLGVVFQLEHTATGWKEHVLHNFPAFPTDGYDPDGGPTLDQKGNVYGTTLQGGSRGNGTVFELTRGADGGWKETILYHFPIVKNGAGPEGGLAIDPAGNLYGTAGGGTGPCGGGGCGVVFKMSPPQPGFTKWTYTVLHRFTGPDGALPVAGLTLDCKGNLYGTTSTGGANGCGRRVRDHAMSIFSTVTQNPAPIEPAFSLENSCGKRWAKQLPSALELPCARVVGVASPSTA